MDSSQSNTNKQENHVENAKDKKSLEHSEFEENTSNTWNMTTEDEDTNASITNTNFEGILKPRWIMQPKEIYRFKIRYQPGEIGFHQQTYMLSIIGSDVTYDINVQGTADIPTLDMNPKTIFSKVIKCSPIVCMYIYACKNIAIQHYYMYNLIQSAYWKSMND